MALVQHLHQADAGLASMRSLCTFNCCFSRQRRFQSGLGSAEIRVLSKESTLIIRKRLRRQEPGLLFLRKSLGIFDLYAASNLIYNYV